MIPEYRKYIISERNVVDGAWKENTKERYRLPEYPGIIFRQFEMELSGRFVAILTLMACLDFDMKAFRHTPSTSVVLYVREGNGRIKQCAIRGPGDKAKAKAETYLRCCLENPMTEEEIEAVKFKD